MTEPWTLARGATVRGDGSTRFAVWAPFAQHVDVLRGDADQRLLTLEPMGGGVFAGSTPLAPPGTDYRYRLDGATALPDPVSRYQPGGVHGPSRVVDAGAFRWTDDGWTGPDGKALVLYELHVGAFTAGGTFDDVAGRLADLRGLGITAVELMPVGEFPGRRNWGYDGVHPYAPHSAYGGPDGLRRLVDAAHAAGLAIVLDVVYNHLGPEGSVLGRFGPYFTDRYRTPWGDAINFDGPDSDEVRRYFIDNALYWITEFHVDGLRLDAVHAIYDFGARHILAELADAAHAQGAALGRDVLVIAESDLNDPRVVRAGDRGGWGCDAQWSDDFHHAVHAVLTGERGGYYVDFGEVKDIAKALRARFVLDGEYSVYRRRRHGAPAVDVAPERFVVSIQNHDQVGNRLYGERLASLVPLEPLKLAAAALLLSPYVPLLFMGEESAETNPFLYFVSHESMELLEAVRQGRRRELDWDPAEPAPDPATEETFLRSRIDWDAAGRNPMRLAVAQLYRDLLRLRATEPALQPGTVPAVVRHEAGARWVTVSRTSVPSRTICTAFNFSGDPTDAPVPVAGRWKIALATADSRYGGAGGAAVDERSVAVPPWSAVLVQSEVG